MFNILKETTTDILNAVDTGTSYVKEKTITGAETIADGLISVKDKTIDGVSQVGSDIVDASGIVIGHVSTTGEIIADSSLKIIDNVTDISSETKEEIFKFISDNKSVIIMAINSENETNEFTDTEMEILILKIIHGLLPFPFGFIIPEDVFIALGQSNYSKIKALLF